MLSIYEHTIDLDKTKKKKVECEAYCINSLELAVSHCLFCSVQRDQDPYVIAQKKEKVDGMAYLLQSWEMENIEENNISHILYYG